jgi:hypothetical protein
MRFVWFPKDPKMRPLAPAEQHCLSLSHQNRGFPAQTSGPSQLCRESVEQSRNLYGREIGKGVRYRIRQHNPIAMA